MTTKLQQFCIDILPVIQAGAKGAKIGVRYHGNGDLIELDPPAEVGFASFNKYEVMRDMIEVNGFKVPAGERVKPSNGSTYYVPRVDKGELYQSITFLESSKSDMSPLNRGVLYLNKEDAIARANAMMGIDPYPSTNPDVPDFVDAVDVPE